MNAFGYQISTQNVQPYVSLICYKLHKKSFVIIHVNMQPIFIFTDGITSLIFQIMKNWFFEILLLEYRKHYQLIMINN